VAPPLRVQLRLKSRALLRRHLRRLLSLSVHASPLLVALALALLFARTQAGRTSPRGRIGGGVDPVAGLLRGREPLHPLAAARPLLVSLLVSLLLSLLVSLLVVSLLVSLLLGGLQPCGGAAARVVPVGRVLGVGPVPRPHACCLLVPLLGVSEGVSEWRVASGECNNVRPTIVATCSNNNRQQQLILVRPQRE
jgi:hypothetical protein